MKVRAAESPGVWLLAAMGLSLVFRLPDLPFLMVDWDENTFALMGDSLLRGHLPYTELTDNKPPLIFVLFAVLQLLFGKSILAIRLAATVLTALTAWLCALVARRAFGAGRWSLLAILAVVTLASRNPGTGALMSEHLAMLLLAAACFLLTAERFRPWQGFLLSLCAALAVLTRTNLAYPALLLGGAALFLPLAPGTKRIAFLAAFAAGAMLPLLLLLAAYRHHLTELYQATVAGPLAYAGGARPFTPTWFRSAGALLDMCFRPAMAPLTLGFLAGAAMQLLGRAGQDRNRRVAAVLVTGWLGTAAGVAAGGALFTHYLLQLLPFMAPLLACALARTAGRSRAIAGVLTLALVLGWCACLARPYLHHYRRLVAGEPLCNDPPARLTAHLEQAGARGQTLFLADAHVAYWLLDAVPPTRIVHPSNLGRGAMMRAVLGPQWTAEGELDAIFARRPLFVVLPKDLRLLNLDAGTQRYLLDLVAASYRLDKVIEHLRVFRRLDPPLP